MNICIIGHDQNTNSLLRIVKESSESLSVCFVHENNNESIKYASEQGIGYLFSTLSDALITFKPDIVYIFSSSPDSYGWALESLQHECHVFVSRTLIISAEEYQAIQFIATDKKKLIWIAHPYYYSSRTACYLKSVKNTMGLPDRYVEIIINHDINKSDVMKYAAPNIISKKYDYPGGIFHEDIYYSLYILMNIIGPINNVLVSNVSSGMLPQNLTDKITLTCTGEHGKAMIAVSYGKGPDRYVIKTTNNNAVLTVKYDDNLIGHELSKNNIITKLYGSIKHVIQRPKADEAGITGQISKIITDIAINKPDFSHEKLTATVYILADKIWPLIINKKPEFSPIIPQYPSEVQKKPCVLVTGATGALGVALSARLQNNNYRVRALVRKLSKKMIANNNVEIYYGDISDLTSLENAFVNVDYVIHAAADTMATNIGDDISTISGTQNIVALCKKYNIKKLIYISTCNVYGVADYEPGYRISENSPLEQYPVKRGSYTYTKLAAESIVQEKIQSGEIDAVCVRPGTYFGVGSDYFTALIGFSFKNKLFITIGYSSLVLPLVCTENVADAIVFMLENRRCNGNTYNIIDNDAITKKQYVRLFIKEMYPGAIHIHLPFWLLYMLIAVQERVFSLLGIRPVMTRYRYLSSQNDVIYVADKIHKDLSWNAPRKLSDMMNKIIELNDVKEIKGLDK